jgi:hypothetical protein
MMEVEDEEISLSPKIANKPIRLGIPSISTREGKVDLNIAADCAGEVLFCSCKIPYHH